MLRRCFRRSVPSVVALILLFCSASEIQAYANTQSVEQSSRFSNPPLIYQGIKKGLFDIDRIILKRSNIEFASCEYVSQLHSVITSYHGVGSCIYLLISESLSTPNRAGFIRAKAHRVFNSDQSESDSSRRISGNRITDDTSVNIFWSPSVTHYSTVHNFFRMIQEYLVPFMIKNHEDALWGTWLLQFPDHDGYQLVSNKVLRAFALQNWSEVEWASISLFSVPESEDPAFYQGMIYFFNHGSSVTHPVYELYFKTDLPSWNDWHFLDLDGK